MLTIPPRPTLHERKREPSEPGEPRIGVYHGNVAQANAKASAYRKYADALENYEREKQEVRTFNGTVEKKNDEIWRNWFDSMPDNPLMNKIMEHVRDRYRGEWNCAASYLDELVELCELAQKMKS